MWTNSSPRNEIQRQEDHSWETLHKSCLLRLQATLSPEQRVSKTGRSTSTVQLATRTYRKSIQVRVQQRGVRQATAAPQGRASHPTHTHTTHTTHTPTHPTDIHPHTLSPTPHTHINTHTHIHTHAHVFFLLICDTHACDDVRPMIPNNGICTDSIPEASSQVSSSSSQGARNRTGDAALLSAPCERAHQNGRHVWRHPNICVCKLIKTGWKRSQWHKKGQVDQQFTSRQNTNTRGHS